MLNIGLIVSLLGSMSGLSAAFGFIDNRRYIVFDFNTMKRSIEDTPIVFIGAGNLATNLAKALYRKGFRIVQVYSRTMDLPYLSPRK